MAIINENDNDAGAGIETEFEISLGDAFQGSLAASDYADWVRVELDAGIIYDISQTESVEVRLSLFDSEGNRIIDGNSRPAGEIIIFSPDASGTYYISIHDNNIDTPRVYNVSLTENTIPVGTNDEIAD